MLVLIDESGDAGLKVEQGSSPYFFVTLVVFTDLEEAAKADECVQKLRVKWNKHQNFEFKFNKASPSLRRQFLEELLSYDYRYFSIVIDKQALSKEETQAVQSFYEYACALVCTNAKPYLHEATVIIDGSGSREFKRQLGNSLKKQINDKDAGFAHIKKVKLQDSHTNNLLQLVDMVCGAVARSYRVDRADAKTYREIIKDRETFVQLWPEKK